jgi:hypothetical protein
MSDVLEGFRNRLLARSPGEPKEADPPAASLGAGTGIGIRFENGAEVGLYEFDSFESANEAARAWEQGAGPGALRKGATNGVVLFAGAIGRPDEDDAGPLFALSGLVSAFAGKE